MVTKKQAEIGILEKSLARKSDHVNILLKKDKELTGVLTTKKKQVLAETLMESTEPSNLTRENKDQLKSLEG